MHAKRMCLKRTIHPWAGARFFIRIQTKEIEIVNKGFIKGNKNNGNDNNNIRNKPHYEKTRWEKFKTQTVQLLEEENSKI